VGGDDAEIFSKGEIKNRLASRILTRHGDQFVELWSGLVHDARCRRAVLCLRGAEIEKDKILKIPPTVPSARASYIE
jgi:hypothetical protein